MKNNISEHVTYDEATHSNTGVAHGIDNEPDDATLLKMECVAKAIFEPVRAFIGIPIKVNSFYRSIALNKAVGGASNSQHVTGEAMDLDCNGHNKQIFHYILNYLIFDQLIWEFGNTDEPDWVHVSRKETDNRNQALMSVKIAGVTKYFQYR
jgi:hypothetical protein